MVANQKVRIEGLKMQIDSFTCKKKRKKPLLCKYYDKATTQSLNTFRLIKFGDYNRNKIFYSGGCMLIKERKKVKEKE